MFVLAKIPLLQRKFFEDGETKVASLWILGMKDPWSYYYCWPPTNLGLEHGRLHGRVTDAVTEGLALGSAALRRVYLVGFMLCYPCLGILNTLCIRGPVFLLCPGHLNFVASHRLESWLTLYDTSYLTMEKGGACNTRRATSEGLRFCQDPYWTLERKAQTLNF